MLSESLSHCGLCLLLSVTMAAASTARGCAVLCWGNTADGQLGLGGIEEEQIAEPRLLPAMRDRQLRAVACGDKHTLFAMSDGSLYTCGNGDCGQLGHARPRKRPGRRHFNAIMISSRYSSTIMISTIDNESVIFLILFYLSARNGCIYNIYIAISRLYHTVSLCFN